jgi:hypothetical protein
MESVSSQELTCGIIMPISSIDGCSGEHWAEVKSIITESVESIKDPTFLVRLVSDADDVGVIQKRIVQNIYSSEVVICDVSGKNPNVMFELGMRLAFDKPTIIIKDDKTEYSFDTGIVEHLPYPRDLRFNKIVSFKSHLADKVLATYRAAKDDPDHSTFLKSFGTFRVASLSQDEVPADKIVVEMLGDINAEVARLRRQMTRETLRDKPSRQFDGGGTLAIARAVLKYIKENPSASLEALEGNPQFERYVELESDAPKFFSSPMAFRKALTKLLGDMPSELL